MYDDVMSVVVQRVFWSPFTVDSPCRRGTEPSTVADHSQSTPRCVLQLNIERKTFTTHISVPAVQPQVRQFQQHIWRNITIIL